MTTFPSTDVSVGSDFDWRLVLTLGRATFLPSGTRIVFPETGGPKTHYEFDEAGNYVGKW